jgi:ABC-2 type transport system ATP-binding protein
MACIVWTSRWAYPMTKICTISVISIISSMSRPRPYEIWATVRQLVADGTTVLLTTQYLDEADQLADRITIVDHGRVVADGTAPALKSAIGTRVHIDLADGADQSRAARLLAELTGFPAEPGSVPRTIVGTCDPKLKVPAIVREFDAAGVAAAAVTLHTPSLDEVFLSLTGSQRHPAAPVGALEGNLSR